MNEKRLVRRRSGGWAVNERNLSPRFRARGFTMLELLLGIGLMALFVAVLVGFSTRLSEQPATADDVFWKTVMAARKTALQSTHDVHVAFADDRDHGKRFTVTDGTAVKEFPVIGKSDVAVNFLSAQKVAGSAVVLAGQVVETQSLPFVTFYGDGTCTAFRVQIRVGVDAHVLAIDPWTCAPMLVPADRL